MNLEGETIFLAEVKCVDSIAKRIKNAFNILFFPKHRSIITLSLNLKETADDFYETNSQPNIRIIRAVRK
jgi:hypothetical protein